MAEARRKVVVDMENSSDILPGIGIGPYRVGMPVSTLLALPGITPRKRESLSALTPRCVYYDDTEKGIEVEIDTRIGLCFQIVGRAGFLGKTSQGICIGMKASEALTLDPSLSLDDFYGTLESRDFPGYYLELEDPDPLAGSFAHLRIVGIGVTNNSFLKELEIKKLSNVQEAQEQRERMTEYYRSAKNHSPETPR